MFAELNLKSQLQEQIDNLPTNTNIGRYSLLTNLYNKLTKKVDDYSSQVIIFKLFQAESRLLIKRANRKIEKKEIT